VLPNNGFRRLTQFNRFNRFSIHTEPTEPTKPTKLIKPILVFLVLGLAASAYAAPGPNEPAGFQMLNDQPWDQMTGNGWNYLKRTGSGVDSITTDNTAPSSPPNQLRIMFTSDMQTDTEPSVHWVAVPNKKELYSTWSGKVSPNWTCGGTGCGKINFLFTASHGQVYTEYLHPCNYLDPIYGNNCGPDRYGPPYKLAVNTEWAPYGQWHWMPNVTTTLVNAGEWHRFEFYYKWETTPGVSGDGIIRWWVDGILNGNYTNVHYPADSFIEFQYAPTRQVGDPLFSGVSPQYEWIDHTYLSVPGSGPTDTTSPSVPSGLSATAASASQINLAWTASTDNVGVTGYKVYRCSGASCTPTLLTTLGNVTSYPSTGLSASTLYRYQISAIDAANNESAKSAMTSATTQALPPPSTGWPNEPAGFVQFSDQPWNAVTGNGWNYTQRTASKPSDIFTDLTAPFSAQNTLRMIFTTDMGANTEPGAHYKSLPNAKELYVGYWIKVSPNWKCSPAGCGKITFFMPPSGAGVMYGNLAGVNGLHYIHMTTTDFPGGFTEWMPNVVKTDVLDNQWYRVEMHMKWDSSLGAGNGIIRWWVNGTLNGNYTNVSYPANSWTEFLFAPTLQNPPPAEQYMYFDHTYLSLPGSGAPPPPPSLSPGTVTNFAVASVGSNNATLSFTEVDDGTGSPAKYDVRYAVSPISWGSATSVSSGTCSTPVAGNQIGAAKTCTVFGLQPSTPYQFQLIAFRGTLNVDAIFGGLSNVASGTTSGSPPPPPPPPPPPASGGIAALYPGDIGIENHPDVVFTEMFEEASISNMTSRYNDVANSGGMAFTTNIPAGSGGSRALQMTSNANGPQSTGLYKMFTTSENQQWYLRYYINYNSPVIYGHTGTWFGGYNPPLTFPNPRAGVKPAGNDRFSTGAEPLGSESINRWMQYTYWKDMRPDGAGTYWGNILMNDAGSRMTRNQWHCVETTIKLNNPVTDTNGELAMWIDGQKVLHMGKGYPNGTWSGGQFTPSASGTPFGGFQWRNDPALNLNYIWLQNYLNDATNGAVGTLMIDHLVLAKNPIGCLGSGSPPPVSACDINNDSATNVSDVQLCANQAIGVIGCTTGDINHDSSCNVIDVQRVVNAALGGQCVTQ
jgi:hypothetical protein